MLLLEEIVLDLRTSLCWKKIKHTTKKKKMMVHSCSICSHFSRGSIENTSPNVVVTKLLNEYHFSLSQAVPSTSEDDLFFFFFF